MDIKVIIRKSGSNFGAFLPSVDGFVITSDSVNKLKKDLLKSLDFHFETVEPEDVPQWYKHDFKFVYDYDLLSLINNYDGIFNQSVLARIAGINESLMRQYALGLKKPSKKKLLQIQDSLNKFGNELQNITIQQ